VGAINEQEVGVADVEEKDRHHPLGRVVFAWKLASTHQ
jgi:hypothetical protein